MHPHDQELDVRGLKCPLPILRTKKALADMTTGTVLRIVATDPGTVKDFAAFARQTGHELLASGEQSEEGVAGEFVFLIRRK
jgi:tRNA 2-thiouridine synthesizing protein A